MKLSKHLNIAILTGACFLMAGCNQDKRPPVFQAEEIPASIQEKMKQSTWRPGCPVPLEDLRYLQLSYWGYDGKPHQGQVIVHKDVASEVTNAFRRFYRVKFPIERMQLMAEFKGNDEASMEANNTSAFNCRSITNRPGVFSEHSYGRAIDINTRTNPYVNGNIVLPKNARPFLDRSRSYPGKIDHESIVYRTFIQLGWKWGGDWESLKDYQHFEKKRRSP